MKKIATTAMYAVLIFGALSVQSCKDKPADESSENGDMVTDTVPPEGMSSRPVADTIITENDTVISTKDASKGTENVTGDQAP